MSAFDLVDGLEFELAKAKAIIDIVSEGMDADNRKQLALYGALKILEGCEETARDLRHAIDTERSAEA